MLTNYNPDTIDTRMSPNETMKGDNYFWVGATAAEAIMTSVMTSRLADVTRVLDLPCGHGRVLRYLVQLFPDAQFDACDLDNDGVRFCADTFNARPILSQENLIKVAFDATYDLIWIGSLFTHTSLQVTKQWLTFLAGLLSEHGIIVATFHGRWTTRLQKLVPYIDDERWAKIIEDYDATGYGYEDYRKEQSHDFIQGSYGLSVVKPHALVKLLEDIPGTRIYMYQEKGWGNHHDVIAFGRPNWDESWW
jgi:SAM-dependent methyltransferase